MKPMKAATATKTMKAMTQYNVVKRPAMKAMKVMKKNLAMKATKVIKTAKNHQRRVV